MNDSSLKINFNLILIILQTENDPSKRSFLSVTISNMKIIVVAGGQGTKLWPYSRSHKPKQFQAVLGDKSLFTENVDILLEQYAPEDIFISTKQQFIKYVSDQAPRIPLRNYIIEPNIAKDRGPGEGLAFLRLSLLHPDEPFFVIQSDCIRQPKEAFLKMMLDAETMVKRDRKLITGGIKATEPDMGSDYLKLGKPLHADIDQDVYAVDTLIFRGSNYAETKKLVESFSVVVHCNHSCWFPELMLDAYKQYRPDWHEALMRIKDAIGKPGEDAEIERLYAGMEKGATEDVTKHIFNNGEGQVILVPFRWSDIGTWGSVYEFFSGEPGEVYADGRVVSVDASDTLVKVSNPDKLVAIAGIDNLVVVDTDDVLMIIPKTKIDKLKDLQKAIGAQEGGRYL